MFLPWPQLSRDQLVLPGKALELVERQVLAIAAQRERLRASGQHVKRGLLLYGPPGNGKTLTVRYIVSKAQDHTVLVLTGGALDLMRPAGALARMLEPVLVVLEDVDLVSEDRGDVRPRQEPGAVRSVEPDGWEGRGRRCCVPADPPTGPTCSSPPWRHSPGGSISPLSSASRTARRGAGWWSSTGKSCT